MREGYRKLNMSKLNNRKHKTISTAEALQNITPIQWSENVLNGITYNLLTSPHKSSKIITKK